MTKYLSFIFLLLLISCGTRTTSFQVLEPGTITLPANVQTIGVINRYKPERKKDKILNVIEGLLTGEMIGTDKLGSRAAVDGLSQKLSESPRVKVVHIPYELLGSGTGFFPEPMSPEEIRKICEKHQIDAVVMLEAFDHDISRRIRRMETKKTVNGREVIEVSFRATKWVRMKVGWRVYDATGNRLIDEHTMFTEMGFDNTASTEQAAILGLPAAMDIVPRVGNRAGMDYATRIAPHYLWISREYFTKTKNPNIRQGATKARIGSWEEAAESWTKATNDPNPKNASKAYYNLSVAAEATGNLDAALQWAQKAFEKQPKSRYEERVWEIKQRIQSNQKLQDQMEPVDKP